jgi:hypothetical protein
MIAVQMILGLTVSLLLATTSNAASVSNSRQSCILGAMAAGSAALNNPAELNALYERYFVGEKIAQIAAGIYWNQYDDSQKDAQRSRVQQIVVGRLAPGLSQYKSSHVKFLGESDSKVRGIVTAPHGERRRITWHFDGSSCKFINIAIDGLGSLISLVGKEPIRE